jgi:D-arabinose 1-dehydrogenase-like Zn-dependent alcohol dehydrogenase
MRAVVMHTFGDEDVLKLEDVQDPSPGPGEAVVRVGAVEVSSTRDVATRTGHHPFSRQVSLPHVLGGDFAGVVEMVGSGVDQGLVGRRVAVSSTHSCGACPACLSGNEAQCAELWMLGIHRWGSYAELVTVPASNLHEIPEDLSLADAAALAATGPVALTQLQTGQVSRGTWLLVTGITGSLGTTLATLGDWLGARVIGLSRRPATIPPQLALEARFDSTDSNLATALQELTAPAGVTIAIDNIAAPDVFAGYFPALAIGARVVISGAVGTPEMPVLPVPAAPFYVRSMSLLGVRTTTPRDVAAFWALVSAGLRLPAGLVREMPLESAAEAHQQITNGGVIGHTVLTVAA